MQNVSSAYLEAIRSSKKPYSEVYGTITFTDNTTLSVTPSIMPEKSINIERKCVDGSEIEFGGVYLGVLELSLRTTESRYKFFDARVVLSYRIEVNNAWESVKLGEFTIANADRPDKNTVKFTAYDDMQKLDKPLQSTAMSGTPYELLSLISTTCDYPLGFTQSDMAQFANNTNEITIDENSGISTYRDAVKVICQQLGCFARDNRNGQLELVKFGTSVVRELTTADWFSITPADYECRYVGLSVTSAQGTFVSAISSEDVKGNVLKISDAPAWDYGTEQYLQSLTDNLFTVLRGIIYTPFQADVLADPSYDCGDRIKCTLSNGDEIETIITSYEWTWHDLSLVSKGVNPNLQGASTNDLSKRLITKESSGNKFTYYTWLNTKNITLTTSWARIVRAPFTVGSMTTVTLWHEFKWLNTLSSATQKIELKYSFDGAEFDYQPIQTYGESGYHTWGTQFWLQNVEVAQYHTWEVFAKLDSGSCAITAGDIHALIQGQNLAPQDEFDGYLEVDEEINVQTLGRLITPLTDDTPVLSLQVPISVGDISETISTQNLGRLITTLTEGNVILNRDTEKANRVTESGDNRVTEDGRNRVTEGNLNG